MQIGGRFRTAALEGRAPRAYVRIATLCLLVAVAIVAALLHSPEQLLAAAEAAAGDPLLFSFVVLALYLLRPVVLWPTTLVAVVVGYGFGFAAGVPIALAGAVLTSVAPFYLARRLGRDAPIVGSVQSLGERFFETAGPVRGVIAGRLVPIPADAVTAAAAVAGVRFRQFALGVLVGELPWTVAAVAVGASLATLTTEGAAAGGARLAALTTLAALALLVGPAYSRYGSSLPTRESSA